MVKKITTTWPYWPKLDLKKMQCLHFLKRKVLKNLNHSLSIILIQKAGTTWTKKLYTPGCTSLDQFGVKLISYLSWQEDHLNLVLA